MWTDRVAGKKEERIWIREGTTGCKVCIANCGTEMRSILEQSHECMKKHRNTPRSCDFVSENPNTVVLSRRKPVLYCQVSSWCIAVPDKQWGLCGSRRFLTERWGTFEAAWRLRSFSKVNLSIPTYRHTFICNWWDPLYRSFLNPVTQGDRRSLLCGALEPGKPRLSTFQYSFRERKCLIDVLWTLVLVDEMERDIVTKSWSYVQLTTSKLKSWGRGGWKG